jgi:hypothetical protein
MKNLLLLMTLLINLRCHKDKETAKCIDAAFVFVNQSGEDIYNPSTLNHLDSTDIKAYAEDSINRVYDFGRDDDGNKAYKIFLYGENSFEGDTYVKLGNITIDTIHAVFEKRENSIFISQLFYNSSLIESNLNVSECYALEIHKITVNH